MSNGNDEETNFGHRDGVDLRDLFTAQVSNIRTLINANDVNYNQRFDNVTEATKAALAASDRAVAKAEGAAEKRFDSVNEFRETLADQQRNLMPRSEVEILIKNLGDRVDRLSQADLVRSGQGVGMKEGWGLAAGAVGIIIAILALVSRFI